MSGLREQMGLSERLSGERSPQNPTSAPQASSAAPGVVAAIAGAMAAIDTAAAALTAARMALVSLQAQVASIEDQRRRSPDPGLCDHPGAIEITTMGSAGAGPIYLCPDCDHQGPLDGR